MASILPPIPRFVFTVFEPLSLIAGALAPFLFPQSFISSQLGHLDPHPVLPTEYILALQLGNLYLLLALIGYFVLSRTTEPRVVHGYIWALWIADIGHVAVTCWVMEREAFVDVWNWTPTAWGNIAVTCFLFATRTLYLMGAFGRDGVPLWRGKKMQ